MPARLASLILAALVAAILAPAASASDAQNRVRAFPLAAPPHTGPAATQSPWTRPGTTTARRDLAAGCCVAAKPATGRFGRLRQRLADERGEFDPAAMLGARGTQTTSTTLGRGRGYRIDVENPAPGVRPGQLHLQADGGKYLYDFDAGGFAGLPRSLSKQIEGDPTVARAIAKGRTYLGLD